MALQTTLAGREVLLGSLGAGVGGDLVVSAGGATFRQYGTSSGFSAAPYVVGPGGVLRPNALLGPLAGPAGFPVPSGGVAVPAGEKREIEWVDLDEATKGRGNSRGTFRTICDGDTCRRVFVPDDQPPAYAVEIPEKDKPTSVEPNGLYIGPARIGSMNVVGDLKTVLGVPQFVDRTNPKLLTVNFTAGVLNHNRVNDDALAKLRPDLEQVWCTANKGNKQFVIVPAIEPLLILLADVLKQQKANPIVVILGGGDDGAFDADKVQFPEGCRVVLTSTFAFDGTIPMITAENFKKVTKNKESLIVAPAASFLTTPGATPGSLKKLLEDLSAGKLKKDMTTGVRAWFPFIAGTALFAPTCPLIFGHNN